MEYKKRLTAKVDKSIENFKAPTPIKAKIAQWLAGIAGGLSIVATGAERLLDANLGMPTWMNNTVSITAIVGPIISFLLQFVVKKIH